MPAVRTKEPAGRLLTEEELRNLPSFFLATFDWTTAFTVETNDERPKRPPNGYILMRSGLARWVAQNKLNSQYGSSLFAARMWQFQFTDKQKRRFYRAAEEQRALHRRLYPSYVYKPEHKRRKKPMMVKKPKVKKAAAPSNKGKQPVSADLLSMDLRAVGSSSSPAVNYHAQDTAASSSNVRVDVFPFQPPMSYTADHDTYDLLQILQTMSTLGLYPWDAPQQSQQDYQPPALELAQPQMHWPTPTQPIVTPPFDYASSQAFQYAEASASHSSRDHAMVPVQSQEIAQDWLPFFDDALPSDAALLAADAAFPNLFQ